MDLLAQQHPAYLRRFVAHLREHVLDVPTRRELDADRLAQPLRLLEERPAATLEAQRPIGSADRVHRVHVERQPELLGNLTRLGGQRAWEQIVAPRRCVCRRRGRGSGPRASSWRWRPSSRPVALWPWHWLRSFGRNHHDRHLRGAPLVPLGRLMRAVPLHAVTDSNLATFP